MITDHGSLEGKSYGDLRLCSSGEAAYVVFEIPGAIDRIGIEEFVSEVEAQDEEVEVETDAIAIANAKFAKETSGEIGADPGRVFLQDPDVCCIHKDDTIEVPKKLETQLCRRIDLKVSSLIEGEIRIDRSGIFITSRS